MTTITQAAATDSAPPLPRVSLQREWQALDDCHQEVLATLDRLQQLCDRLDSHGVDEVSRELAQGIVTFFSGNARQHHADEERLVFPDLLQSQDAALVQHVQRLQQDHGWLEEDWLVLAPPLEGIAKGYSCMTWTCCARRCRCSRRSTSTTSTWKSP